MNLKDRIKFRIYNLLHKFALNFAPPDKKMKTMYITDHGYIVPDDSPTDCLSVVVQFKDGVPLRHILHNLDALKVDEIFDLGQYEITAYREYVLKKPEF